MRFSTLIIALLLLFSSCKKDSADVAPDGRRFSEIILKDYFINSIAFDKNGIAWLGTSKHGLIRYDGKSASIFNSSNSILTDAAIMALAVDKGNNIWIGSDDLIKYDGSKFTRYEARQFGFPKNAVRSVAVDADDNIWFSCSSYQSGGLVKYDGSAFKTFTPANSKLPGNMVQSIVIDQSNHAWVAINDGIEEVSLARINADNSVSVAGSKELGFKPYYFGNIVVNNSNELLGSIDYSLSSLMIAGRPQIFKFNGSKARILNLPDEENVQYYTHRIFSAKNGNLWVSFFGTDKECGIFDGKNWTFPKLGTSGIFAFAESPNGEMWLGTGEGVYILK
ncbi:ligand-binding sensor domain-containing protein [Dyadobacter psychrophilus]|uniref:Two component regulator propeller n=1 Tax=Dyadobacter psychrophilus TaxID=651661 RepID=A0A1T5GYY8_9BACT|nr:two-component regulator propeller domain-containing protein [Dyadobacter psychrophilus]SKC13634.1 hypothetical protein SAMN05660293_04621 [Dyadobacter psychrophilus]